MKASSLKDVRDMYELTAEGYAEMMDSEIHLPIYREVLGRLQEGIANTPGTLLDTACGSGHMLELFRSQYDPGRSLMGIDLSPRMVTISQKRLGKEATIMVGDMRSLPDIPSASVAALINFFAIHHLDLEGIRQAMCDWYRVLVPQGRLLVSAWEGSGLIDYGEESDIIAFRYTREELTGLSEKAGFLISRCSVEPVEDFPMDAVYLECVKE